MRTTGHMRRVVFVAVVALAGFRMMFAQAGPPRARVQAVTETLHGVAVTDPYRWMEAGGQELTDWMKAQDAYTRALLEQVPGRAQLLAELRALNTDATTITEVRRIGGRYFYLKRNAGEQVAKLDVRESASGVERVLVDPGVLGDAKQRFTIAEYAPSPDGRYVAFRDAAAGSQIGTLRVVEVATGRTLPDKIGRSFYFNSWRPDGRAFAYTRLRDLPANAPQDQLEVCPTVYLHVLGSVAGADQPLVGCGISPRISMEERQFGGVIFSTASTYVLAWVALDPGITRAAFYTAPVDSLAGSDTPWRRLAGPDDQVSEAVLRGETAYLVRSRNAPRRQVVRTRIDQPDVAGAEVVVPQSEAVVAPEMTALTLTTDALYVRLLDAGVGRLLRVPFDGTAHGDVPLPYAGSLADVSADPATSALLFSLQSWVRAPRFYTFDPRTGTVDTNLAPQHPAERPGFEATQVKVRSADGTLVPLTIISRAKLKRDRSHPVALQGYGAYGTIIEPAFRPSFVPWLERDGVMAFCHARGGGEYGEAWHAAGQKQNKPNTVSDFIACAQYLVAEGYTTQARLAGAGASAGGIMIGGAITRRPDLLAVASAGVPAADLLRFEFSRNGPNNIPEFGTVKDPNDFRAMLAVSPYEHITTGTRYPAVLVTTAINDERVPPWQPAKFVARLQAATASGKPVLLRVDWGSGHFGGATTSDQESQVADSFSFMLWQMGVAGFQPPKVR